MNSEIKNTIQDLINSSRVFVFMKGTPEAPACGFSAHMIALLVESGIYFESFDVYSDEDIRQAVKEYSDWPTYPQLYIDGKLIGGIDIVSEMYDSGEIVTLKNEKKL